MVMSLQWASWVKYLLELVEKFLLNSQIKFHKFCRGVQTHEGKFKCLTDLTIRKFLLLHKKCSGLCMCVLLLTLFSCVQSICCHGYDIVNLKLVIFCIQNYYRCK